MSRRFPVISNTLFAPTVSFMISYSSTLLLSIQMRASWRGFPSFVTGRTAGAWLLTEITLMSSAFTQLLARITRMHSTTALHQSSGSCCAQEGSGRSVPYSFPASATTFAFSPKRMHFTVVVPMSIPME